MKINDYVIHEQYGRGQIFALRGTSFAVQFDNGKVEVLSPDSLRKISSVNEQVTGNVVVDTNKAIANLESQVISYVNDTWGLFSKSAIQLLPHQLWVCNQVLEKWPVNYVVADDVGLGKTVEAGLIINNLIASQGIKRILILTPAKLTQQWQQRMYEMFGLAFKIYSSDDEKINNGLNYWDMEDRLIASFSTVQIDSNDRHKHMLEAKPWDLVVVDEAHHMYADENGERQKFHIFSELKKNGNITSAILFTGTPHRGKDYGFWSLMSLLDSDKFGPDKDEEEQYEHLHDYLIRNNKKNVVNMKGEPLFTKMTQYPEEYSYSEEEKAFYLKMKEFIATGEMYAKSLTNGSANGLLLTALQKIASSSTAAIVSALENRKKSLVEKTNSGNADYLMEDERDDFDDDCIDGANVQLDASVKLMEDEIERIDELLELAAKIKEESRVKEIIKIIKTRYPNEQVLLFTEYKRTQALVLSELMKEWGKDSVTFINGDAALQDVLYPDGSRDSMQVERLVACKQFNEGEKKFLVSTEAAGEGIDLQKKCHVLIHIDLPWNPMRIHQRIGRVHRLGQTHDVDVISIRSKDNLEARIWDTLNAKLDEIQKMLSATMGDPDDIMQIVLGMQTSQYYESLFAQGLREADKWFNSQTATFGGKSAIETATKIGVNAARFDLRGLDGIPKLDVSNLVPFMKTALKLHSRLLIENKDNEDNVVSYDVIVPDEWKGYGSQNREKGIVFRRELKDGENVKQIAAVGHYLINKALQESVGYEECVFGIPGDMSYFLYTVTEETTDSCVRKKQLFVVCYDSSDSLAKEYKIEDFYKILTDAKPKSDSATLREIPKSIEALAESMKEKLKAEFTTPKMELTGAVLGTVAAS